MKSKEGNGLISLPIGIGATAPVNPATGTLLDVEGAPGSLISIWLEEVSIKKV